MLIEQKKVDTWLCTIGGKNIAIANNRLKMLVEQPNTISIVGAPDLYNRMLFLQGKFYPIVNVKPLLTDNADLQVAALVLYKDFDTSLVTYGAIEFDRIPEKILVSDDMSINLTELPTGISGYSLAGFEYVNKKIGVLDVDKIFNL